jgi:uncharacterized protein YjbI with pentapeptide repeats
MIGSSPSVAPDARLPVVGKPPTSEERGRNPTPALEPGCSVIGRDLSGQDLSGQDLSGVDFSEANLTGARLIGSRLRSAVLHNATLTDAELLGADLQDADLTNCRAQRASFNQANLHGATLFDADLDHASLIDANLTDADLRRVTLRDARARHANLHGANLSRANLRGADLTECLVDHASFVECDLRGSRLKGVHGYVSARFLGADIRDVDFSGAYLVRRQIMDENYLEEFRSRSRGNAIAYWLWSISSDCGRSALRWSLWVAAITVAYGAIFSVLNLDYGDHPTPLSPYYFSLVTLTTLGYGDVLPADQLSQAVVMTEVVIGYMMLGGLLSIFSNKMARRAE